MVVPESEEKEGDHSFSAKIGGFLSKGGDIIREGLITGA